MGGKSEFFCMVKSDISDDVVGEVEPSAWTTFRWIDEFGNSIAAFFTSLEAGQPFVEVITGWAAQTRPGLVRGHRHSSRHQTRHVILRDRPHEYSEVQGAESGPVSDGFNLPKASGGMRDAGSVP